MFVESFPLSVNGKVQRKQLPIPDWAASISKNASPPITDTEVAVAVLVAKCLRWEADRAHPCAASSFFELGGDSQTALRLLSAIRSQFSVSISVQHFFDESSIRALAERIDASEISGTVVAPVGQQQLVRLDSNSAQQCTGSAVVLVCAAGASSLVYRGLAGVLSRDGSAVFAVEDRSLVEASVPFDFVSIEEAALSVGKLVRDGVVDDKITQVVLGGWSYGGVVAFEAAKLLSDAGISVPRLHLFDAPVVPAAADSDATDLDELGMPLVLSSDKEKAHFTNCVRLLQQYHQAMPAARLNGIDIHNCLSSAHTKVDQEFDFSRLTSGNIKTQIVQDSTHWDIVDRITESVLLY